MSSLIAGKRIAFTGAFYKMSRKEAAEKAAAAGAIVAPQFTKNCDLLVTGGAANENSAKRTKAEAAGTQVIAEADFFQAIGMPVPQYDQTEFKSSARRGRSKKLAEYPEDFGLNTMTPAPVATPQPVPVVPAPTTPAPEAAVQPDGSLVEEQTPAPTTIPEPVAVQQPVPVQPMPVATEMPTAQMPVGETTPKKTRRPRGPRAAPPPVENPAPVAPVELTTDGTIKLTGKTVVFTGRLTNLNRLTAATLVHRMGGNVSGSITSKTDLLVCGEGAGLKQSKAQAKGIPTISEDDFVAACANSQQQPPEAVTPQPNPAAPKA